MVVYVRDQAEHHDGQRHREEIPSNRGNRREQPLIVGEFQRSVRSYGTQQKQSPPGPYQPGAATLQPVLRILTHTPDLAHYLDGANQIQDGNEIVAHSPTWREAQAFRAKA